MRLLLSSFCVFLIMTCLVSMMAVFIGAESKVLGLVLLIQAGLTPFIVAVFVYYTWLAISRVGLNDLLALYRRRVAGWMWFVFWSINSLVIAGELTYLIIRWASEKQPPWLEHAPLWCAAACTFAVLSMYMWDQVHQRDGD